MKKRSAWQYLSGPVLLCMFFLCGCSLISPPNPSVRFAMKYERDAYYREAMLQSGGFSFRTQNFLRSNLFHKLLNEDPAKLVAMLEGMYRTEQSPMMLEILADICFNEASRSSSEDEAVSYYLSAAIYSYQRLFSPAFTHEERLGRFDPSSCQQLVCYNASIAKIFEYLRNRQLLLNDSYELKDVSGRRIRFDKLKSHLPFPVSSYDNFVSCSAFKIQNMTLINRRFGIGVPLVAVAKPDEQYRSLRMPGRLPMPATVVLNLDLTEKRESHVSFEIYDTFVDETVKIDGAEIPLALDYSTPIAAFSEFLPEDLVEDNLIMAMLRPENMEQKTGLYMLEPYDPGKIPVVFVHGLMSSPDTWNLMMNALRNYPAIRRNYQFWFYRYSSGNPVIISAATLRDQLYAAEKEFAVTPEAKETFSRMVIVGHSMGGLITRTLMQDNPNYLLEQFSGENWNDLSAKLTDEERKELQSVQFPKPGFVNRVVLMAVPHRGSTMAKWSIARFGSNLIRIPSKVVSRSLKFLGTIIRVTNKENELVKEMVYTGIDNLDPDNRFIRVLSGSSFASGIPVHSVIGDIDGRGVPGGTDGIVPYSSSHIDGVASELIVDSGHSVQKSPEAIRELARILRLHLLAARKNGTPLRSAVPVKKSTDTEEK